MTEQVYLFDSQFFPKDWPGTLVISQGMWPTGQGNMQQCAAGSYDPHFAKFGSALVAAGRERSIVRLGWEMNGNWWEWSGHSPSDYRSCFQHIATAIRSKAPQVRMDWTVNAYSTDTCNQDASNCYPGDNYVDIVGIDYYDKYPPNLSVEAFRTNIARKTSLQTMLDFARAHGKKFGIGEWGLVDRNGGYAQKHGAAGVGGDNSVYITSMLSFFRTNAADIAYEAYFETCNSVDEVGSAIHDTTYCRAIHPQGGATYQQLMKETAAATAG